MFNSSGSHIRFWVIYLLVATTFILFALEGLVRLFHLAPPLSNQYGGNVEDPYLPYKPRPFSTISGRSMSDEFDFEYIHNSLGFRDIEHTFEKPKDVFRIVGLGDSFAYGAAVSFEESYLYRLEEMLNSRPGEHPRVEVIKMGIPRFFPESERLVLQHYGLKFKPDLILVGFLPNDVLDTFRGIDAARITENGYLKTKEAAEIGKVGTWLYLNSHTFRLILRKYISFTTLTKYRTYASEVYKPNGYHEKDWQQVEAEYEKMIELAYQANARIVFLHIPQKGPWDDTASYPASRLSAWSAKHNVTFIDGLPAIKEAAKNEILYWEKDGHTNSAGDRVLAETIYLKLIEEDLVP